jgi:hypothetical protein
MLHLHKKAQQQMDTHLWRWIHIFGNEYTFSEMDTRFWSSTHFRKSTHFWRSTHLLFFEEEGVAVLVWDAPTARRLVRAQPDM